MLEGAVQVGGDEQQVFVAGGAVYEVGPAVQGVGGVGALSGSGGWGGDDVDGQGVAGVGADPPGVAVGAGVDGAVGWEGFGEGGEHDVAFGVFAGVSRVRG
ncbi:hypothetical protein [Actinoplanes sp. G11-F43]|uniref:hypothetical protein n=1 Tax=Actinoplanes sp. G11-F43 TaxID=3424130 RepID=UPI003D327080